MKGFIDGANIVVKATASTSIATQEAPSKPNPIDENA